MVDSERMTALMGDFFRAGYDLDDDAMDEILQTPGFDVNFREFNRPVIFEAIDENDIEWVRKIVSHASFDPSVENKFGQTALRYADIYGTENILRIVREHSNEKRPELLDLTL